MANGRAVGRVEAVLGLVGIVALAITYSLVTGWNPVPAAGNWLEKMRTFSEPAPAWKVTVGDQPATAVLASDTVIVSSRGSVEARRLRDGEKIWSRDVDWAEVAGGGGGASGGASAGGEVGGSVGVAGGGSGDSAVVIAGRTGRGHGYDAVDPGTGRNLWQDDDAIGVWTFTDLVVGIACPDPMTCVLTARSPASGTVRWTTQLTGNGRTLAGANKGLSALRSLSGVVEPPRPVPAMLGFPLDGQVEVVSSATGRRLHSYQGTRTTRAVLAGDHVLITTVTYGDGHCRYAVDGRDPESDRRDWHLDGYDLRTSSGLGCEQRKDPAGAGRYPVAVGPDNHELLLDATSGAVVYRAGNDESIVNTDGRIVLVRTADGASVRAVDLSTGSTAWTRTAGRSVKVGLGPGVAVFSDPGANQLAAVGEQDGRTLLDTRSGATVLGYADNGLVVNIGRTVGLLTYRGAA